MFDNKTSIDNNYIANGICPSPTGEARWRLMSLAEEVFDKTKVTSLSPTGENERGLKFIGRVTCSFPWGRLGWV